MFSEELKKFVEDNPHLVSMKPAGEGIFVLKYKKRVFYDSLWNTYLEECRGTIVDKDFNVISRPFTKIYNFRIEAKSLTLDDSVQVTAFEKVNGFMVAVTVHRGELLVSTTGSTDSKYVDYAKELMVSHAPLADWLMILNTADTAGMTFVFEACHKDDPHIIPETAGMYLLGYRANTWESKVEYNPVVIEDLAAALRCFSPARLTTSVGQLVALSKASKIEGFVFYTDAGESGKIKSPYYLTSKWVARNPRTHKLVNLNPDIKHNIDEEYHNLIDSIRLNIVEYTAMSEQERLAWVRAYFDN